MAKPELGTKRLCGACGAKFYDLGKTPILCPKCGTVFEIVALPVRARAEPARPVAKPMTVAVAPETADADFVSLEDADAEASGGKIAGADVEGEDEEVEVGETLDAFIEEQEEGDADVTDIIGDGIEKEEET